ncbi:MAG: SprT-like domain-containing protein [Gammaproteobacteria bacterium]|nr:SprT-like domain-containing protein [Gammaproteobacteria bacterium]
MHEAASDDRELRQAIAARTDECLLKCATLCRAVRRLHKRHEIRFDLRGQAAGQCVWRPGHTPLLRFNLALARRHLQDFLATTVAHEVAHLATFACHGRVQPHGPEWQAVMQHLGVATPQRCHDFAVEQSDIRRQRRWDYRCDCRLHEVSTTRHKRMQEQGLKYLCRHCGSALHRVADATPNSQTR